MKRSFTWDRLEDHHVLFAFAAALLAAGAGVAALSLLGSPADNRTAPLALGLILFVGGLCLGSWAGASRLAERRRRANLDRVVDSELSSKWDGGFARLVGAYDKPWFILCGETGAGKTALLRSANLPLSVGPGGVPVTDSCQGLSGTFMFDWWFFADAVVLDSAGDLIQNPDQRWVSFLERVRDTRPMQPINGMVLAVPAPDLLGNRAALRRTAALLASQIAVARRQLRVRFPLYLVITKTDLVSGFSDYFPLGSDPATRSQILGWSNPQDLRVDDRPTRPGDVRNGLEGLVESLRARRSAVLAKAASSGSAGRPRTDRLDELYAFPDAMAEFLDATEEFVEEMLGRNAAEAQPFLRGVYFTSALRGPLTLPHPFAGAGASNGNGRSGSAESQAFFVRDLLLKKVLPESGLVTPLEDVTAGLRRRGRILTSGAAAAAVLITAGTLLGYFQTAGRVRPHAAFWARLADAARSGHLADLAMLDGGGSYRGASPAPTAAAFAPGQTVLDWHTTTAALADDRTSNWLLPLSARTESRRIEAHRELFRNLVLFPSLSPLPKPDAGRSESLPPVDLVRALRPLLAPSAGLAVSPQALSTGSTGPTSSPQAASPLAIPVHAPSGDVPMTALLGPADQLLKLRARSSSAELSQDDLRQLSQLLHNGASGTAGARLPDAQRLALASWLNDQVQGYLQDHRAEVADWAQTTEKTLAATRKLAEREEQLLPGDSDEHNGVRMIDRLTLLATTMPSVLDARKPAEAQSVTDEIMARFDVPPSVAELRRALEVDATDPNPAGLPDLLKSLDEYEHFLADQCRDLGRAAAVDLPANEQTPLPELRKALADHLTEFDRLHLGDGRPRILRRTDAYARLLQDMELGAPGAVSRQFAATPVPGYGHPFFSLPAALSALRDTVQKEKSSVPQEPFGPLTSPSAIRLNARFDRACASALDQSRVNAESGMWDLALRSPERIWVTPEAQARPDGKLDLTATEADSPNLLKSVTAPPDLGARHFIAWLAALATTEAELRQGRLRDPASIKVKLDSVAAALEQRGNEYVMAWQAQAALMRSPNLHAWKDLKRLGTDGAEDIQDRLNRSLSAPRAGIGVAAGQDRFPSLKQSAVKALAPLNDTALPPTAPAIFALLKSCDPGSASHSRDALLRDRLAVNERFPQAAARGAPGTSAVQDFWADLMGNAVDALVAEMRPEMSEHLEHLHAQADGRFPLYREATGAWEWADLTSLRKDLDALRPPDTSDLADSLSRRVRDSDVVSDEWGTYIDWLRRLDAFLQQREAWSMTIRKADRRGSWQAAWLKQAAVTEQMYRSADLTPTFSLEGGGALHNGLSLVLLTRLIEDGGVQAATIRVADFHAPWSLLRLGVEMEDQPFKLPILDSEAPAENRSIIVTLRPAGQAVLRDMPAKLPDLPTGSKPR
jgi:hypothetical protein